MSAAHGSRDPVALVIATAIQTRSHPGSPADTPEPSQSRPHGVMAVAIVGLFSLVAALCGDGADALAEVLVAFAVLPSKVSEGISLQTPISFVGAFVASAIAITGVILSNRKYEAEIRQLRGQLRSENREQCKIDIDITLAQAIDVLSTRKHRTRSCLFLPSESGDEIYIAFQCQMDEDPDIDVTFAIGEGCAGRAWKERRQSWADLESVDQAELETAWNMKDGQIELTKGLGSVICTPVLDPRDRRRVLGIFAVDSTGSIRESKFRETRAAEFCRKTAKLLASYLQMGSL
jgi:hypothetical protein